MRGPLTPQEIAELTLLRQTGADGVLHDVLAVPWEPRADELDAAWRRFDAQWNPALFAHLDVGEMFLWIEDIHNLGRRAMATLADREARAGYERDLRARGREPALGRGGHRRRPSEPVAVAPPSRSLNPVDDALAHMQAGRFPTARDILARALRERPRDPELLATYRTLAAAEAGARVQGSSSEAALAADVGDTRRADRLLRQAVETGAADVETCVRHATAMQAKGEPPERVAQALLAAVQQHPGELRLRIALAEALLASGRPALAARQAREALQLRPGDADARRLLRRAGG